MQKLPAMKLVFSLLGQYVHIDKDVIISIQKTTP